jgi:hypothetical protein
MKGKDLDGNSPGLSKSLSLHLPEATNKQRQKTASRTKNLINQQHTGNDDGSW